MTTPPKLDSAPPDSAGLPNPRPGRAGRVIMIIGLVIIVVGAIGLVAWQGQDGRRAVPPTEPGGWRIEQYQDITFEVPDHWTYDFEPGSDWCVEHPRGAGRPVKHSYVALGHRGIVRTIDCGRPMPNDFIVEHVAVLDEADVAMTQREGRKPDGPARLGNGFWEITRTIGALQLRAVSRDGVLAQRIVDSAAPAGADAPCPPRSPMLPDPDARPEPSDVTRYGLVDRVVLCQYEGPDGLGVAASMTRPEAQRLIAGIAGLPRTPVGADCRDRDHDRQWLDVSVVIRVESGGRTEEIFLRLDACSETPFFVGGFDDGTHVRMPDRATCRAVFRPPLRLSGYSEAVYPLCGPTR